jgi:gas vesicle protein
MGQDPDAIREDIAQTRAELGETVEAIGYKADVPSRAKEAVGDKVDSVKAKVSETATRAKQAVTGTASRAGDAVSETASRVGDATPSGGEVKQQTRRVAGLARENPLGLAVGAVAVGFLAGLAVPSTRVEDERLGPVADTVKDKVRQTGQEALERGRQVAQDAAGSAAETARQRSQEHGQDLAESAKQNAQEVRDEVRQGSDQGNSPPPAHSL